MYKDLLVQSVDTLSFLRMVATIILLRSMLIKGKKIFLKKLWS